MKSLNNSTLLKVPKRDVGEQIEICYSESQPSVLIKGIRHESYVVNLGSNSGIYGIKGTSNSKLVSSNVAQKLFVKADVSAGRNDDRPKIQLMGQKDANLDLAGHSDDSRQRISCEKVVLCPEYLEESDMD